MQLTMEQAAKIKPHKFYIVNWLNNTVILSKAFDTYQDAKIKCSKRQSPLRGDSVIINANLGNVKIEDL